MDPVQLATVALVAHVQSRCLAGAPDVEVEVLDLGVSATALSPAVEPRFTWEGDPCDTAPVLRLRLLTEQGPRRLTVRPRLRPHQHGMTPVTLAVQRGSLRLETSGTLLHDAVVGQTVKAKNDDAHSTLTGVLVAPDLVEVP